MKEINGQSLWGTSHVYTYCHKSKERAGSFGSVVFWIGCQEQVGWCVQWQLCYAGSAFQVQVFLLFSPTEPFLWLLLSAVVSVFLMFGFCRTILQSAAAVCSRGSCCCGFWYLLRYLFSWGLGSDFLRLLLWFLGVFEVRLWMGWLVLIFGEGFLMYTERFLGWCSAYIRHLCICLVLDPCSVCLTPVWYNKFGCFRKKGRCQS